MNFHKNILCVVFMVLLLTVQARSRPSKLKKVFRSNKRQNDERKLSTNLDAMNALRTLIDTVSDASSMVNVDMWTDLISTLEDSIKSLTSAVGGGGDALSLPTDVASSLSKAVTQLTSTLNSNSNLGNLLSNAQSTINPSELISCIQSATLGSNRRLKKHKNQKHHRTLDSSNPILSNFDWLGLTQNKCPTEVTCSNLNTNHINLCDLIGDEKCGGEDGIRGACEVTGPHKYACKCGSYTENKGTSTEKVYPYLGNKCNTVKCTDTEAMQCRHGSCYREVHKDTGVPDSVHKCTCDSGWGGKLCNYNIAKNMVDISAKRGTVQLVCPPGSSAGNGGLTYRAYKESNGVCVAMDICVENKNLCDSTNETCANTKVPEINEFMLYDTFTYTKSDIALKWTTPADTKQFNCNTKGDHGVCAGFTCPGGEENCVVLGTGETNVNEFDWNGGRVYCKAPE